MEQQRSVLMLKAVPETVQLTSRLRVGVSQKPCLWSEPYSKTALEGANRETVTSSGTSLLNFYCFFLPQIINF